MKKFKQLQFVLFSVLIALLFLATFKKTYYYPIKVEVEMKCDTVCNGEVFYSSDGNFNEIAKVRNQYSGDGSFQRLSFLLPAVDISRLRLDPTSDPVHFSIRKICFKGLEDSVVIKGQEILSRFSLLGLHASNLPDSAEYVHFIPEGNDPILNFNENIQDSLNLVDKTKSRNRTLAVLVVCVIVWLLLLIFGQAITTKIRQATRAIFGYMQSFFLAIDRKYAAWVIALVVFKFFLISAQPMCFITNAVHDDALYINMACFLANGQWLGDYSQFTLIKGFMYSVFIVLSNSVGLPLPFSQFLLLVVTALIFVYALSGLIRSRIWKIVLFAVILFNPMTTVEPMTRVLREGIYSSLGVLVFATFIGLLVNRNGNMGSLFRWSILASLALFAFWNTREEGVIMLPAIVWFSVWGIFLLIKKRRTLAVADGSTSVELLPWKKVGLFILPFLFLGIGNSSIATINYFWYGKFIVNEIKSGAFAEVNTVLTKIADDENKLMVPVTKKMRMKAYEVSPKFRELQVSLEDSHNIFLGFESGYPDEYKGGWFYWALRWAADQAGYHQTLLKSQDFYRELANEINQALDDGRLPRRNQISLLSFSWDQRYTYPFIQKFKEAFIFASTFRGYHPYPRYHQNSPEMTAWFQNITLATSGLAPDPLLNLPLMSRLKYAMLKIIARVTAWLTFPLTLISMCCFMVMTVLLLFRHRFGGFWIPWVILSGLFMMINARVALIAYLAVTQFNAIGPHYLNFVYHFFLIFIVLTVFFGMQLLRALFSRYLKN